MMLQVLVIFCVFHSISASESPGFHSQKATKLRVQFQETPTVSIQSNDRQTFYEDGSDGHALSECNQCVLLKNNGEDSFIDQDGQKIVAKIIAQQEYDKQMYYLAAVTNSKEITKSYYAVFSDAHETRSSGDTHNETPRTNLCSAAAILLNKYGVAINIPYNIKIYGRHQNIRVNHDWSYETVKKKKKKKTEALESCSPYPPRRPFECLLQ